MADMLNAEYLVSSNPLRESPVFKAVWQGIDYNGREKYVYENSRALPRIFFVDRFEVQAGGRALSRLLTDVNIDVSKTALLEHEPLIKPISAEGATAAITDYRFNEVRVKASLPSAALMMMGEIYYPSWQVEIDGEPGEIIRANHILRAIPLTAGEHELVFRYDTSLLTRSLTLSVGTFSVALVLFFVSMFLSLKGRMNWKRS
jgi:hypothetical protein